MNIAIRLAAAVASGLAMRSVLSLEPTWWLAWVAPAALLALAYRSSAAQAAWSVGLAALIGTSVNFPYFQSVMPTQAAALAVLLQALLWVGVVLLSRRVVKRFHGGWTVLAYPVLWTAADTLAGHFLPDANWGSIGYTQADCLPVLQLASLLGVGGIVFMLSLCASALAMPRPFGLFAAGLGIAATLGYGLARQPPEAAGGTPVRFGLAAIDDFIGARTPPDLNEKVWRQYDSHVVALARSGAQVILLPEKIAVVDPAQAARLKAHFSALAARLGVTIVTGIGVDDGQARSNRAWLFSPSGALAQDYQKQHMAPPEREFVPGRRVSVQPLGGVQAGLAICKDMHFASFGRQYEVDVMLVPAWDFRADAAMANAITRTRGVENGYMIVRAARDGHLTVSDRFGRILGQQNSRSLPGAAALFTVDVRPRTATAYSAIGDALGWLCALLAVAVLAATRFARRG